MNDELEKKHRYFSGYSDADPKKPLKGEISPQKKRLFRQVVIAVVNFAVGAMVGSQLTPETPADVLERASKAEAEQRRLHDRIGELEVELAKLQLVNPRTSHLKAEDRARHEQVARQYKTALRLLKAQAAGELMEWFVGKWNTLLDHPEPEDRTTRRAATLALLIGGMAENIDPADYVSWQAQFYAAKWLGEVHADLDGDGLPGKRSAPNLRDGFASVSVCHIAMALNLAMTDARILVMPDLKCERPDSRISMFLQGPTWNDALDEFVENVKREGFIVVQRNDRGTRLILLGAAKRARR